MGTFFLTGLKRPGKLPITLGHEITGDVVSIGEEVKNVKAGDRVVVYFYLSCGKCEFCRSGQENLCRYLSGRPSLGSCRNFLEVVANRRVALTTHPYTLGGIEQLLKQVGRQKRMTDGGQH